MDTIPAAHEGHEMTLSYAGPAAWAVDMWDEEGNHRWVMGFSSETEARAEIARWAK